MTLFFSPDQRLKAFINAAQYFAGLTFRQNIWEEAARVLIKFFGADFAAFARRAEDNPQNIKICDSTFSEAGLTARISETEMLSAAGDVFESGFLTFLSQNQDDPMAIALFPVHHENQVMAVMLVGHRSAESLSKEILDLYLAVAGLIGATHSRKSSEMAVLQAKEDWERTFDAVPDLIALLDLQYRIVRANKAMAEKLQISQEQCVGLTCYYAVHGTDEPPPFCPYTRVLQDGQGHSTEMYEPRLCADFFMSVSPLRDRDGKVIGGVYVARDISERKRSEKELEKYRVHLEDLVEERTAELVTANKEMEGFSYSVSHDLRAPLRHIAGFMELLRKRISPQLDEKSLYYMTVISKSAKKMGILIDDLLAFSRMGRTEMKLKEVDLNLLVQDSIRELKSEANDRHIKWQIDDLPQVYGDKSMLGLVFVNLFSNALKYTSTRAHAEINFSAEENQDEYIFCIKDNGVGFDMKYADKLFGVFQRLHTQDEFEGTGIGLANVRRIISRHGGRIWAQGVVDRGAEFYFTLPKAKNSASD